MGNLMVNNFLLKWDKLCGAFFTSLSPLNKKPCQMCGCRAQWSAGCWGSCFTQSENDQRYQHWKPSNSHKNKNVWWKSTMGPFGGLTFMKEDSNFQLFPEGLLLNNLAWKTKPFLSAPEQSLICTFVGKCLFSFSDKENKPGSALLQLQCM